MARNQSALVKEFSKKDSNQKVKELIKERIVLRSQHFRPGTIIFTSYNAKYKEFTYDKTPLILILKRGKKHSLGINFHWLPLSLRLYLIKHILTINKNNIRNGKLIEFNYEQLKPMLKSLGYAPCIRKYINPRMGRIGVVIPPERLTEVARLRAESFTNGKYSSSQLYKMARAKARKK